MDFKSEALNNLMRVKWAFIFTDLIYLIVAYMIIKVSELPLFSTGELTPQTFRIIRMLFIAFSVASYLAGTKYFRFPKRGDYHTELTPEMISKIRTILLVRISLLTIPVMLGFVDFLFTGSWYLIGGGAAIGVIGKFGTFMKIKDI